VIIASGTSRTVRFAAVGVICAVAHNAIMLGLDRWQVHYALSCALSYVVVVVLGYKLHVHFTFEKVAHGASFWRYAAGMAANYPLTLLLLFAMCDLVGWPVTVAAPVATLAMLAWNFCASRWAIVRTAPSFAATMPWRWS
jgi:putative flippase GtrA